MSVLSVGDFKIRRLESKVGSVEIGFWGISCRRELLVFGKEFVAGLKFTNTNKAINDHVDPEDITTVESLFGKDFKLTLKQYFQGGNESLPPLFFQNLQPHQKLFNRHAIIALCLGSRLPGIKPFRRWVYNIIDEVMETGSYSISNHVQQLSLEGKPVEKVKSTFKDIPNFKLGEANTVRKELRKAFKEGGDLSVDLGRSIGGSLGGTERDRRDKSRIKLLVKIYNSKNLQDENLKEELEEIITTQKLLEIEF